MRSTTDKKDFSGLTAIVVVAVVFAKAALVVATISVALAAVCAAPVMLTLSLLAVGELLEISRSRRAGRVPAPATAEA